MQRKDKTMPEEIKSHLLCQLSYAPACGVLAAWLRPPAWNPCGAPIQDYTIPRPAADSIEAATICAMCSSLDRKSTRLISSHVVISYAVFCLNKKTKTHKKYNHIVRQPDHRQWLATTHNS